MDWFTQLSFKERCQLATDLELCRPTVLPPPIAAVARHTPVQSATDKPYNIVIFGFSERVGPFQEALKQQGNYHIVEWFSKQRIKKLHETPPFVTYDGSSKSILEIVCRAQQIYLEACTRRNAFLEHDLWHEHHKFHGYLEYFAQLLVNNRVQCVVFANLPHEGPDFVLYHAAKALGITTICFFQVAVDRVAYVFDLNDFGIFADVPETTASKEERRAPLEQCYRKVLPYMQTNADARKYSLWQLLADIRRQGLSAIQRYARYRAYQRDIRLSASTAPDLHQWPYVYFPLHLQPELTTTTLGGPYRDQLTAIEHLSQLLPPNWRILVKENPKQGDAMRPRTFFERLRAIPRVVLVNADVDTYQLISYAQFVATITGTAGWEAVSGGKSALVFGRPWYLTLPGVFSFQKLRSIDEVVNYRIDHSQLVESYASLCRKMCPGLIVDTVYIEYLESFDEVHNAQLLGSLIHQLCCFALENVVAQPAAAIPHAA